MAVKKYITAFHSHPAQQVVFSGAAVWQAEERLSAVRPSADQEKAPKRLWESFVISVPRVTFITVGGKGDPNTSADYTDAVELLYGLSYTKK